MHDAEHRVVRDAVCFDGVAGYDGKKLGAGQDHDRGVGGREARVTVGEVV